jgi:hypothetical protein
MVQLFLIGGHGLGLVVTMRLAHELSWLMLPLLWLILPLLLSWKTQRFNLRLESLAPLSLTYVVVLIRLGWAGITRWQGQEFLLTGTAETLLNLSTAISLSLVYVWAIQAILLCQAWGISLNPVRVIRLAGWGLLGYALLWSSLTYLDIRTRGTTASDPYAYVQMGYDLATTGHLQHRFDTLPLAQQADLDTYPLVPIGYRTPNDETHLAATVWAPGFSVGLALTYWLMGEIGFYLLAPLCGILALGGVYWLAQVSLSNWPGEYRALAGGSAALILATAQQQVLWLAVPMADVPSQLFTMLAVIFALRTRTQSPIRNGFWSGLCLGVAFAIRYTQVLIGFSLVLAFASALLIQTPQRRRFWQTLIASGAGAWLMAAGVLWYHTQAFGHPFHVGSEELGHFALANMRPMLVKMFKDAFIREEFRWLAPFLLWGMVVLWRRFRSSAWILLLWVGPLLLFHLPYGFLRLRDLLSLYPVLSLCVGVGIASLAQMSVGLSTERWRGWAMVGVVGVSVLAFQLRSFHTLQYNRDSFNNFGYLRAEQRQAFETIAEQTPKNALIGVSLHAGPVMLYSQRDIARPYDWDMPEWLQFIAMAHSTERPVYLLVDGVDMQPILSATQAVYPLRLVAQLPLPYFYPGGGSVNQVVDLYVLEQGNPDE